MRKVLLFLAAISVTMIAVAQDSLKQKEVGVNFYDLSDLGNCGLTFKIGSEKSKWRFSALHINGDSNNQKQDTIATIKSSSMRYGLEVGKEFRKNIGHRFDFVYGACLSASYDTYSFSNSYIRKQYNYEVYESETTYKSMSITPGLKFITRFDYYLKDNIILGAEILPFVSYSFILNENERDDVKSEDEYKNLHWGLNSNSLVFSISYRF